MYIGVLSSVGCKCLKCLFCTVSGGAGGKLQPTVLSDLVSPEGFVRINSSITPLPNCDLCAPQASILEPLLVCPYINELPDQL